MNVSQFPLSAQTKVLVNQALSESQEAVDLIDAKLKQCQADIAKMKKAGLSQSSLAVLGKNIEDLRAKKKEAGPEKMKEVLSAQIENQEKSLGKRQDKMVATLLKKIPAAPNPDVLAAFVVIHKILGSAITKQDKISQAFDKVTPRKHPVAHLLKGHELYLVSEKALSKVEEVINDLTIKSADNLRASSAYPLVADRNDYAKSLVVASKDILKNMSLFDSDDLYSLLIPFEQCRDLQKMGAAILEGNPGKIDRVRDSCDTDTMDAIPAEVHDFLDGVMWDSLMWDKDVSTQKRPTKKPKR